MTARQARQRLGLKAGADEKALRAAFREAARRTHPDRPGGDAAAFREVLEAYRLLREQPSAEPLAFIPAPAAPRQDLVEISPEVALLGGEAVIETRDGRRLKLHLPPGLRTGQTVRADGALYRVAYRGGEVTIRGDDLWITVGVTPAVLSEGGRIQIRTPAGERDVWVSRKAGARGLVRLPGAGLPATGKHRHGDLFIRLTAGPPRPESAAKTLLRRFAAAWAA